ncbi:MAG: LON peptidase substrate-binding domain-containing protein, partial [Planctomycetota bacterium]
MSSFEDLSFSLEHFSGRVRLFPLPNLVLFPHVMQPLHVFEPRYRNLLEDALDDDRLIAMATLAPGWESDYEGRPPLYPVACLGRITTYHRLDDGTYNVLLLGLRRVRVVRELTPASSFREAEVELCEDYVPPARATVRAALRRKLRNALLETLPSLPEAQEQLDQLLGADVSLGVLTDVISYMLDLDLSDKEALLAQTDVY